MRLVTNIHTYNYFRNNFIRDRMWIFWFHINGLNIKYYLLDIFYFFSYLRMALISLLHPCLSDFPRVNCNWKFIVIFEILHLRFPSKFNIFINYFYKIMLYFIFIIQWWYKSLTEKIIYTPMFVKSTFYF